MWNVIRFIADILGYICSFIDGYLDIKILDTKTIFNNVYDNSTQVDDRFECKFIQMHGRTRTTLIWWCAVSWRFRYYLEWHKLDAHGNWIPVGFLWYWLSVLPSLSLARSLFSLTFEKDGFKYGFAQNGCCLLLWSASVHNHRSQRVQGGGRLAWDINMFTTHNAIVLMFLFFGFKNLNYSN